MTVCLEDNSCTIHDMVFIGAFWLGINHKLSDHEPISPVSAADMAPSCVSPTLIYLSMKLHLVHFNI